MTGGVEEGDLTPVMGDAVGTDVLGDATRFAFGDVRLTDGVEERGFAVVNMPQNGDNGGARD